MEYYLVDFENVRSDGIKDFHGVKEGDTLVIFYSENCKSITLDVLDSITFMKLNYQGFKIMAGTKNALDFQLSSYLGYLIGQSKGEKYHIVSDDKGFDVVVDFWKRQGVQVDCISLKEPVILPKKKEKSQPKKEIIKSKLSKVADKDLATLDEVKSLIGQNNDPAGVLEIINQYKTRVAINNGLAKHFKSTKKASEIYKMLKDLLKAKKKT